MWNERRELSQGKFIPITTRGQYAAEQEEALFIYLFLLPAQRCGN